MPHQDQPSDNRDEFVKAPAEMDIVPSIDQIPAKALDRAIENLVKEGGLAQTFDAAAPLDDLTNPIAIAPPQPTAALAQASANPPPQEMDPLHPGAEVWKALEQEADEEDKEKLHNSNLHHPEPPEELPDISNL